MAKLAELQALAGDLRKRLRQVDQLTGKRSDPDRDVMRRRESRAVAKEVKFPACDDLERRTLLKADDTAWLRLYFPDLFWYPLISQRSRGFEATASGSGKLRRNIAKSVTSQNAQTTMTGHFAAFPRYKRR